MNPALFMEAYLLVVSDKKGIGRCLCFSQLEQLIADAMLHLTR